MMAGQGWRWRFFAVQWRRCEMSGTEIRLPVPVNERDHIIGAPNASVTIVKYGDYESPDEQKTHLEDRDLRKYAKKICEEDQPKQTAITRLAQLAEHLLLFFVGEVKNRLSWHRRFFSDHHFGCAYEMYQKAPVCANLMRFDLATNL
jgi:hypothetical protein